MDATKAFRIANQRRVKFSSAAALRWLTFLLAVLPVLCCLFQPFVVRQDRILLKPLSLDGSFLLSAMGGGVTVISSGNSYQMDIPAIFSIMVLGILVLQSAAALAVLVSPKLQKLSGLLSMLCFLGLLVVFCVLMLTANIQTTTLRGEAVPVFKVFQLSGGFILSLVLCLIAGLEGLFLKPAVLPMMKKYWFMYLLLFVPIVLLLIFNVYPILLQTVLSFKDYRLVDGVWGSDWVGLKHFQTIFGDPDMGRIIWNTVYISVLRLIAGFLPPILLALMINEITHSKYQKTLQTITYLPHFFSWVIIYGIVFAFLSPNGVVNNIAKSFGSNPADYLTNQDLFVPILVISAIWKELGWGTIIYLAALTAVDGSLYDAAAVDGVGPIQKLWYITLPEITPIIVFMTIMSVGNLLKGAGGEQILLFSNLAVMRQAEVIDTWVYWQGLGKLQYGLGAAVSFFQSGIGVVMVLFANRLSVKLVGRGMW